MDRPTLIRITTVPQSLKLLLEGQHRFMSANGFEVVGIASEGPELREVERNEGIRVIPVEMTRTISPVKDLVSVWKLYKIFRRERPQIVHTHTPKAGTLGMLAAKLAGVPHRLHTVAGLPLLKAKGRQRWLLDFVEKRTYSWATKVYPNSFGLYEIILNHGYTAKNKIRVLGNGSSNGIDTDFFNPEHILGEQKAHLRDSLGIKPDDFVYIFVGRLVGDKGINELVEAFAGLELADSKLILVGPQESDLDPLKFETLDIMETNPSIICVGSQRDVRPYFAISDVLVFPSHREGLPNVVMQAGAMGLPSIVTDINGCNEIVVEGINGTIVPVENVDTLRVAMLKLLEDSTYRRMLQSNARAMIEDRYKRNKIWEALLVEYNSLHISKFNQNRTK